MDGPQLSMRMARRRRAAGLGVCLVIVSVALPAAATQAIGRTTAPGLTLWLRDPPQRRGDARAGMLRLDESTTVQMRVRTRRDLFPVVTGWTGSANMYVDICVPDAFEVSASPAWPTVEIDDIDCIPYSTYIPVAEGATEASARQPLRVRPLAEGTFRFPYKIVAADGVTVRGEFGVTVRR
jgi:hypothetical protein